MVASALMPKMLYPMFNWQNDDERFAAYWAFEGFAAVRLAELMPPVVFPIEHGSQRH
jgi:hypothetical protein